ncbi:hypothetical protein [Planctomycetes bacterium Pla163]
MRIRPSSDPARSGMALAATLVVFIGMVGLTMATLAMSRIEVRDSRRSIDDVRAQYLAESGVERGLQLVAGAIERAGATAPLENVVNLFGGETQFRPFDAVSLMDDGAQVGAYSVTLTLLDQAADRITLRVEATGYLPDHPRNLGPNQTLDQWESVSTTVRYQLEPSEVFNYAYFINNWGWLYGNTIDVNGNVRSNGQFDAGGYKPTINGQPAYEAVNADGATVTLTGYQDSNGDGLLDGEDGGIWSGWDIANSANVRGIGGEARNQHEFDDQVEMPNLSDLSQYVDIATEEGSSITIGGVTMTNAVYGDEPGEKGDIFLYGTPADPIVLDGPVVIDGDVIIYGTVTGQGSIFASGNVYIPDSLEYANPPTSVRPADTTQAETEAWLTANWDKDFLGLYSAENIVVGDHTHKTWKKYVGGWMKSSLNSSVEDAGEDGIPNTKAGKDGILGTADDDVLEGDGIWTVETYSETDDELGLIPAGYSVGDPIPGSGEDIDGDGTYDTQTTLTDVTLTKSINSGQFGGNVPLGGVSKYSDIATLYAGRLDAVMYTNHSFCWTVFGGAPAQINGAVISRNENIVYGTPSVEMNYDCRLLGGVTGKAGKLLPQIVRPPQILMWRKLDTDPNRGEVAP